MNRYLTILALFLISCTPVLQAQQSFQNVAAAMGISGQTGLGHAVGWGDIDNDGDPDLGLSNQEGDGFWFYRNDGDHFTNITASGGLGIVPGANKIIIAEVTGDEFNDLIIRTRSSTQYLFESNGDGTFNNITTGSGIAGAAVYNIADFDNDGNTDLLSVANNYYSILYGNGDGTFQPAQNIVPYITFWGVAVFDYDRDGFMDFYATTYNGEENILMQNNGDGTFTNTTIAAGLSYPDAAHAIDAGDFNNDGWIDIYLGSYSPLPCKLFKNNGDGTFTDIAPMAGATGHNDTRTVAFVDYNNDGWLDIFSSHHNFYSYSNTMLRNNGDETFTEVAVSLGLSGEWIGDYFGQGWADFNRDGAIDLFAAGHIDKYRLFKNTNCPNSFVSMQLKGIQSNPNGIGARVDVWLGGERISRNVLPNGGFHDFGNLEVIAGLNGAYSLDSIIVYWPSGITQKLGHTNGDEFLTIIEDETTDIELFTDNINDLLLAITPNPVSDQAVIHWQVMREKNITITLVNIQGQEVRKIFQGAVDGRKHQLTIPVNELTGGIYFLKAETENSVQIKKIIVL